MVKNLRNELGKYRRKYGLQERIPCSKEDNEVYLALLASEVLIKIPKNEETRLAEC